MSAELNPMECDEELFRHLGEQAKIMEGRWFHQMTPTEAREAYAKLSSWHRGEPDTNRPVGEIVDEVIRHDGEPMRVRIYRPQAKGRVPVVVYFHGGGWVFGNIDAYDQIARLICDECDVVVVNVDYPLAPEHQFPEPLLGCVESVSWAKQNSEVFGGDPDALLVMGDSAGGNLSAATALECAHRNIELAGQVVLYGPLVHMDYVEEAGVRAWSERDQRFGPTFASTSWYWNHYVGNAEEAAADPLGQCPPGKEYRVRSHPPSSPPGCWTLFARNASLTGTSSPTAGSKSRSASTPADPRLHGSWLDAPEQPQPARPQSLDGNPRQCEDAGL